MRLNSHTIVLKLISITEPTPSRSCPLPPSSQTTAPRRTHREYLAAGVSSSLTTMLPGWNAREQQFTHNTHTMHTGAITSAGAETVTSRVPLRKELGVLKNNRQSLEFSYATSATNRHANNYMLPRFSAGIPDFLIKLGRKPNFPQFRSSVPELL